MVKSMLSYNIQGKEFEKFYNRIQPIITSTLYREAGAALSKRGVDIAEEIKDLSQTVWLEILVGIKNKKISALQPAIFVAKCKQVVRTALKQRLNFDYDFVPLDEAAEQVAPRDMEAATDYTRGLERVFSSLSKEDRALFNDRTLSGTSYNILAQEYGEPEYVLKMRMVRIKRKIKKELDIDVEI